MKSILKHHSIQQFHRQISIIKAFKLRNNEKKKRKVTKSLKFGVEVKISIVSLTKK